MKINRNAFLHAEHGNEFYVFLIKVCIQIIYSKEKIKLVSVEYILMSAVDLNESFRSSLFMWGQKCCSDAAFATDLQNRAAASV